MKNEFEDKLIRLEDFSFIKVYLGEFHNEFFENMIS